MHKHREIKLATLPAPKVELINLIDVLITLIAFFLLTTVFNQQTNKLEINLPLTHSQSQPSITKQVELQLDQDGKIFYQGTALKLNELKKQLQLLTPETALLIKADRACPFQPLVDLLELLKNIGLNKIAFATREF